MQHPEEQFKTESERVHLLASEKEVLRRNILAATPAARPVRRYPSPFSFGMRFVAAPLVLLLLIGGPFTYAAQRSAPGDFLYQFELKVVEPVEASLQFSSAAQADFHTSRLEERLDELKMVEEVDPQSLESVTQNIEEHVEGLTTSLASSTEPTEEKIHHLLKSQALVEAHEEVLADLSADTEDFAALGETVEEELGDLSQAYLTETSESEVASTIAEALTDIGETASTTGAVVDPSLRKQILNITNAVKQGDLEGAFELSNDIQMQVLKQQYLAEEDL